MFNLSNEIAVWRKSILKTKTCTKNDADELESHLREELDLLKTQNLTEREAFIVAVTRIGKPAEITGEFAKINKKTVSYRRILWACFAVVTYIIIFRTSFSMTVPGFDIEKIKLLAAPEYVIDYAHANAFATLRFWLAVCYHITICTSLALIIIKYRPSNRRRASHV